jgi:diadenosine tetraphosphate (Ap4A) HIT family hydrolase
VTTPFTLDPRLAADTVPLVDLALCRVLLMNDARFPWLILVSTRPDLCEITDLDPADRLVLWDEITRASDTLRAEYAPTKINIGALGNIVRQLHVHVVARFDGDAAWPGPVWGAGVAEPYDAAALATIRNRMVSALTP